MKIKEFFFNRRFLLRIFLLVISLVVVLVFVEVAVSSQKNKNDLEQQQVESIQAQLSLAASAIDTIVEQITANCKSFLYDSRLAEYIYFINADYFENLRGPLSSADLGPSYSYLMAKNEVTRQIVALKVANTYIDSVYLYDRRRPFLLHSDGTRQASITDFSDLGWMEALDEQRFSPYFLEPRIHEKDNGMQLTLLTVLYRVDSNVTLVVNIDSDRLYQTLIHALDLSTNRKTFLLSDEGNVIIESDYYPILNKPELLDLLQNDVANKTHEFVVDDIPYTAHTVSSPKFPWLYVTTYPTHDLSEMVASSDVFYLNMAVTMILSFLAIGCLAAIDLYRPIEALLNDLHKNETTTRKKGKTDDGTSEFTQIRSAIQSVIEDRNIYQQQLAENRLLFRSNFVFSLLKGRIQDEDEILSKLDYFHLNIDLIDLYVLIVSLHVSEEKNIEEQEECFTEVYLIIKSALTGLFQNICEKTEKQEIVVILNCPDENIFQLFSEIEMLVKQAEIMIGGYCHAAISCKARFPSEISLAYQEARDTLTMVTDDNSSGVFYYKDYMKYHIEDTSDVAQRIQVLHGLLQRSKEEECLTCLKQIFEEMPVSTSVYQQMTEQTIWYRVFEAFLNVINAHGLQKKIFIEEDLYRIPLNQSRDFVFSYFSKMISIVCREIQETQTEVKTNYVYQIKKMIDENYGFGMSLNYLAEQLGTNPSYISRIIKEKTGSNFISLLTERRMQKAVELLTSTDLSVKEIAEQIGYSNSYYFIKIFKEKTGVTPGEYRNMISSV